MEGLRTVVGQDEGRFLIWYERGVLMLGANLDAGAVIGGLCFIGILRVAGGMVGTQQLRVLGN